MQTGRAIRFNSLLAETAKSADETILLTSETLADALRRVHPDIHAPERRELATQVTQQLLALQPFVFPAVKPKPPAPTAGHNTSFKVPTRNFEKPSRARYPCAECASVNPFDYCTTCRAEWVERRRKAQVLVNAKQRKWYADRRARSISGLAPCLACGTAIKGKRKDARFCSAACRQRAHRTVGQLPAIAAE